MIDTDSLKLSVYLGERDRVGGRLAADVLGEVFERHALHASVLLRGVEGFGAGRRLQSSRLLSLSEDLPVLAVALDARARVEAALEDIRALGGEPLLTLERAVVLTGAPAASALPGPPSEASKLTVYVGRRERAAGRPAHLAVVELLHRRGIAGATVLLGVDGTARGVRTRARFFAGNADVPMMIVSVGLSERIAAVLPELAAMLERPLMSLERVRILKRDGQRLEAAHEPPAGAVERPLWQQLSIYCGEQARHRGEPLYLALVRGLRRRGAAGATVLRGVWGYHGDHRPHGERFWSLRRAVPVMIVLIDRPQRMRRWLSFIDELTDESGLLTGELVTALRPSAPIAPP